MDGMPVAGRVFAALVLLAWLLAALTGCSGGAQGVAAPPATTAVATSAAGASHAAGAAPGAIQAQASSGVAGGADSARPSGPATTSTTVAGWGTILDSVPAAFPVYPGAKPADASSGPVSGAWLAPVSVDPVATWYRKALEAQGFATRNLSSVLEDGSRVLDTASDLPECRIQTTFRPAGGSTMITVLYGSGCAGGGG
jgi:hypothetical protein